MLNQLPNTTLVNPHGIFGYRDRWFMVPKFGDQIVNAPKKIYYGLTATTC
jgi:hypothetical protein